MAGINYDKMARAREGEGRYKEAGDYLAAKGDLSGAATDYAEALSKNPSLSVISDIRSRVNGKQWAHYPDKENLRALIISAEQKSKNRFVGNSLSRRSAERRPLRYSTENRAWAYLSIIAFASALLTITLKLTGAAIGTTSAKGNWVSVCLFAVGCMFTVFYFKTRDK